MKTDRRKKKSEVKSKSKKGMDVRTKEIEFTMKQEGFRKEQTNDEQ